MWITWPLLAAQGTGTGNTRVFVSVGECKDSSHGGELEKLQLNGSSLYSTDAI